jgi:hypothetical protein
MTDERRKRGARPLLYDDKPPDRRLAFGTGALRAIMDYIPVPELSKRKRALKQPWRIVLIYRNSEEEPIGLEIHADVVLGRADGDEERFPDMDLSVYNAKQHGVSEQHVLLRPTLSQLFVIDLGSVSGTLVNAVPQEMGMTRALRHNDTLSLGNLHLTVKIMDRPSPL